MSENKEISQNQALSQDELALRSTYILRFLQAHLTDVKIKKGSRIFNSNVLAEYISPNFNEKNGDIHFSTGDNSYIVERREHTEYLEVSFTRFEPSKSDIVSVGFKLRLKRPGSEMENHIEYHIKSKSEIGSQSISDTNLAVENSIDFISSIS